MKKLILLFAAILLASTTLWADAREDAANEVENTANAAIAEIQNASASTAEIITQIQNTAISGINDVKGAAIWEIQTTTDNFSIVKVGAINEINSIKAKALENIKSIISTVSYLYPVYNTADNPTSGIKEWKAGTVEAWIVADATTPVTWNAGWYVVKGTDVQLTAGAICSGAINLILADGAKLTATGTGNQAGIQVSGEGNSLTIYGQANQSGQLVANGSDNGGAGIGGNTEKNGSNITINGGIITAAGGQDAAGIGGGFHGNGSNITINGGKVTAIGGGEASGIGGRFYGSSSGIYVNADYIVYAGENKNNTTVIDHPYSDMDISGLLENQQYVKITEPILTAEDFSVSNNFAIYNGDAQAATVTLNIDGAGTMTVTYKQDGEAVTPINAGEYDVYAAVTAGKLYSALDATKVGTLTIAKASLFANNFIFSAPENLDYDGNAKTAKIIFDDRDGKLTGCGTITVKYNGTAQAPSAGGEYAVSIDIAEGNNYSAAQGLTSDRWKFSIKASIPTPANNQIIYQSSDHQKITPNATYGFDVTYQDDQSVYYPDADYGVITFDGDITTIGAWAFSGKTTLTTVVWPSTVTSIGGGAFKECTNLSSIDLQEGVTSIGEDAFYGCAGMSELTIPSTVTSIGNDAFAGWTTLTKLSISKGSIGDRAFQGCTNLSSIDLQEGVTGIGKYAFQGCAGSAELTIPSTVTSIGFGAFNSWQTLTKLTVKAGDIGDRAFEGCAKLNSITFGAVTGIGMYAFSDCTNVTSLTILGVLLLSNEFNGFGTAESPVALKLTSAWPVKYRPVNSSTPWYGGYFNCEYIDVDPIKEFLGEMGEPCEGCHAIEVKKGTTVVTLYAPEEVKFKKTEAAE